MRKTGLPAIPVLCITVLFFLSFDAKAKDFTSRASFRPVDRTLHLIRARYGNDIAGLYETIAGMPLFDPESEYKLDICYTRADHPCNEIFLKEMSSKPGFTQ